DSLPLHRQTHSPYGPYAGPRRPDEKPWPYWRTQTVDPSVAESTFLPSRFLLVPNGFLAIHHEQVNQRVHVRGLYTGHERPRRNAALLQCKSIRQHRHTWIGRQGSKLLSARSLAGHQDTVLYKEQRHWRVLCRQFCEQAIAFLDISSL